MRFFFHQQLCLVLFFCLMIAGCGGGDTVLTSEDCNDPVNAFDSDCLGNVCTAPPLTENFGEDLVYFVSADGNTRCSIYSTGSRMNVTCRHSNKEDEQFRGEVIDGVSASIDYHWTDENGNGRIDLVEKVVAENGHGGRINLENNRKTLSVTDRTYFEAYIEEDGPYFRGNCSEE